MRIFLIAFMIAMLAIPAGAQPLSSRGPADQPAEHMRSKHQRSTEKAMSPAENIKKTREEERAANSALQRLPDKPYDPWRNAR